MLADNWSRRCNLFIRYSRKDDVWGKILQLRPCKQLKKEHSRKRARCCRRSLGELKNRKQTCWRNFFWEGVKLDSGKKVKYQVAVKGQEKWRNCWIKIWSQWYLGAGFLCTLLKMGVCWLSPAVESLTIQTEEMQRKWRSGVGWDPEASAEIHI